MIIIPIILVFYNCLFLHTKPIENWLLFNYSSMNISNVENFTLLFNCGNLRLGNNAAALINNTVAGARLMQ